MLGMGGTTNVDPIRQDDNVPEEKPELELEGKQVEDLRLQNPQVGQKFNLTATATVKEVLSGKGENGIPTTELCFELDGIAVEPCESMSMYPSMMK